MSRITITVSLIALSLFSCMSRGSEIKSDFDMADKPLDKTLNEVTFLGTIVAYGSEPNIVWMIKDVDGNLYYPKGDLQAVISKIPHQIYGWRGELKRPVSLLGLIPDHIGHFTEISWEVHLEVIEGDY